MKYRLLFCLIFLSSSPLLAVDFETPPTFQAKDVVPKQLLSGPNHNVLPEVTNNGYQNKYLVKSIYGQFEASGSLDLRIRIREADAFAYLETMSKTEVFLNSLKDAGIDTAKSIVSAFTNPIQTVKGIPDGIARLFSGYVHTAKRSAAGAQRMIEGSDKEMTPEEFKRYNYLVGESERQWASELKIDPYTTNIKLRKAISEMAVVQYIGGLPVDFALPMTASVAVSVLGELSNKIYQQNALELESGNRACLADGGIGPDTIEAFFASYYMTPTMHTIFCVSINRLTGVKNLDLAANHLAQAASFEETRFLLNSVALLTWYQIQHKNLERITSKTRMPYGVTNTNELIAMVPGDHLIWSEALQSNLDLIIDEEHPYSRKTLWMLGRTSEKAHREIVKRGWTIHDRTNNEQMAAFYETGLSAGNETSESVEGE